VSLLFWQYYPCSFIQGNVQVLARITCIHANKQTDIHSYIYKQTAFQKQFSHIQEGIFEKIWTLIFNNHCTFLYYVYENLLITVAARSKAWNFFARPNAGIVGSNATQGTDVCLRLFCVCVVLCRQRPWVRLIHRPRSATDCLYWSKTKCFTDALCSKWEQQEQR
jgi:hypothetical protein